jgi:hypothetical protein
MQPTRLSKPYQTTSKPGVSGETESDPRVGTLFGEKDCDGKMATASVA